MEKSNFNIEQYSQDTRISKQNVTSLVVYNYGATPMRFIRSGVVFDIPIYDAAKSFARGFEVIACDNTFSDIDFEIEFDGGAGRAVLMYKNLINLDNC